MPVTAKLSRRFYEQFGDELTNELVDWFNSVDATYHSDLRELNEINFARFEAKLEQRADGIEARLGARIDGFEAKMDNRFASAEAKSDSRFAASEARMEQRFAERFADCESRMLRWMISLWTGSMLATVGLIIAVLRSK